MDGWMEVWVGGTHILESISKGCCGAVSSTDASGVLCCKIKRRDRPWSKRENNDENDVDVEIAKDLKSDEIAPVERFGRTLSPVQVATYGWVYTF